MQIMYKVVNEGLTVADTIPDDCPPPYADLIRQCVARSPKERPTFKEIIDAVKGMSALVL